MNEISPLPFAPAAPGGLARLRRMPSLAFLDRGVSYAVGATLFSVLSAGTMLVAPRLLDPAAFGVFALLTSLFHYACRSDLGLSQLADRAIAVEAGDSAERGEPIMRLMWRIAWAVLLVLVPLAMLAAWLSGFPVLVTGLALAGGTFAMVGNGPATIHRAASRVWEFTFIALVLQLGMTLPRLAGLVVGGVTGSFAVLLAWYGAMAMVFAPPWRSSPARSRTASPPMLPLLRTALPLFAFNGLWLLYATANRWISTFLSTPVDAGLFAFGASLALVGLGLLGAVAQVRYPRLLSRMRDEPAPTASAMLESEMLWIGLGLVAVAVVACLVAPQGIAFLFPRYDGAAQATVALAVSCVPLGVMAWTMPMAIVLSGSPGRDAVRLLVPGLAVVVAAMVAGDRIAGISGQAWACAFAGLILFASYVGLLHRLGSLQAAARRRLLFGQTVAVAGLAALALLLSPTQARSDTVPPSGWSLAFSDEFETLRLWDDGFGVWEPHYKWGGRTNEANAELQYYVDPRPGREISEIEALEPFLIDAGILSIRADVVPEAHRERSGGQAYSSGLLSSIHGARFTYGYFEMRARVPAGRGLWPAFWLLPAELGWPPEIDVMEVVGDDTRTLHVTVHTGTADDPRKTGRSVPVGDLSRDFHVYGMMWTPQDLTWYLDGESVFTTPTPEDMHQPMYLLVNLAVGGNWPGSPDADTPFPAAFEIDWIRVWRDDATEEETRP